MYGYKAFYNDKVTEVYAKTSYEAWQKAVEFFKVKKNKQHMVHVHLCEQNGEEVVHIAVD